MAEQRERDAQLPERCRHLCAVCEVVVQRIVTEAHDTFIGPGLGGFRSQPRKILGAHSTFGHLHERSRSIAQKEVAADAESNTPIVAEDPSKGCAGTLGPRGFVVARHSVPCFFEP